MHLRFRILSWQSAVVALSALLILVFATISPAAENKGPAVVESKAPVAAGNQGPVEGVHYERISPAQPTGAGPGQVEVVEMFWYGCPHCFRFQPYVHAWLEQKPDNVILTRIPAMLSPKWEPHVRAYYAAESMGVLDKMHDALFNAIHIDKKSVYKEADIVDFVASLGIDKTAFEEAYKSFSVSSKAQKAKRLTQAYGINGVPAIIVDGKYLTSASHTGSQESLIILTDLLSKAELEQAGRSRKDNNAKE